METKRKRERERERLSEEGYEKGIEKVRGRKREIDCKKIDREVGKGKNVDRQSEIVMIKNHMEYYTCEYVCVFEY